LNKTNRRIYRATRGRLDGLIESQDNKAIIRQINSSLKLSTMCSPLFQESFSFFANNRQFLGAKRTTGWVNPNASVIGS
jgi:hypothetical protein